MLVGTPCKSLAFPQGRGAICDAVLPRIYCFGWTIRSQREELLLPYARKLFETCDGHLVIHRAVANPDCAQKLMKLLWVNDHVSRAATFMSIACSLQLLSMFLFYEQWFAIFGLELLLWKGG